LVQPVAHLAPQAGRLGVTGIVLDQGGGHVDAEAGQAQLQPVLHDLAQGAAVGARTLGVDGLPPGLVRVRAGVAEVEGGLAGEEVRQVPAGPGAGRGHEAVGGAAFGVRPDVPVIRGVVGGGREPRVLVGGVTGHQVEQHPDAAAPGAVHQAGQVVVGAVAGGDGEVVGDVVAGVPEGRGEARVEPDGVHAEPLEMVEPLLDAGEVADAVAVGVREALRIDLVEDGVGQPLAGRACVMTEVRGLHGASSLREASAASAATRTAVPAGAGAGSTPSGVSPKWRCSAASRVVRSWTTSAYSGSWYRLCSSCGSRVRSNSSQAGSRGASWAPSAPEPWPG